MTDRHLPTRVGLQPGVIRLLEDTGDVMTELAPIPLIGGFSLRAGHHALEAGRLYDYVLDIGRQNRPITRFNESNIVVMTAELSTELCDEERFEKSPIAGLGAGPETKHHSTGTLRTLLGNGLISSFNDEPSWGRGHRILGNAFSPGALRDHFDAVTDCVGQMTERLRSVDAGKDVDVMMLSGSLFFEIMGLYAFSLRVGAFYSDEPPHVIVAAARVVHELSLQRILPAKLMAFDVRGHRQLNRDIADFSAFAQEVVSARKALGPGNEGHDLLGRMLTTPDPLTGEYMPESEVRYQCLTLLGAGQEGPHNVLSVALHHLASRPELFQRIRAQVDEVLGADSRRMPTIDEVHKLTLIDALVNECLRMYPSAAGFTRSPRAEKTVIGGKYKISSADSVFVFLPMVHRDPAVWDNPDEFDIDRWTPDLMALLPAGAFKPFGTGMRACIGRLLALTEVQTALAAIVSRFDLGAPSDNLRFGVALTLKPQPFTMRFTPRNGISESPVTLKTADSEASAEERPTPAGRSVRIWHASDGGTAMGLASRVASAARDHGFEPRTASLNDAAAALDADAPNIIVAASYNGEPALSGATFMTWLESQPAGSLTGVDFAVFGCGDRHWTDSFQAVPIAIDEQLSSAGAHRLADRGAGDASGDLEDTFTSWALGLWELLAPGSGGQTGIGASLVAGGDVDRLAHDLDFAPAEVIAASELQRHWGADESTRSTVHLEVALPEGVQYRAGDHMLVLPRNRQRDVRRAAKLFGIEPGALVRIGGDEQDLLDGFTVLRTRFDITAPASRQGIELLANYVDADGHKDQLLALQAPGAYQAKVLARNRSLLVLADEFPPGEPLPVGQLDRVFTAIKPRTYSISSAPAGRRPSQASLTVGVLEGPALSGQGTYRGTCSTFIASLRVEDELFVKVKRPGPGFSLPDDPATPVIMVCAGTGIAPFRGFLQELSARHQAGQPVAPTVLVRGCRRSDHDHIYADAIDEWVSQGWLEYIQAFSRDPGLPPHHVEDVMLAQAPRLDELLRAGAKVLVCGDSTTFYDDVEKTVAQIHAAAEGISADLAQGWFRQLKSDGRYVEDIWALTVVPSVPAEV